MIVKTWNDGSYNDSGAGYGIKISKCDRSKLFSKLDNKVIIHIGNISNSIEITLRDTFWTTCSELRSCEIGKYLIDNGLRRWEKYKPHKLLLVPQGSNNFLLKLSNNKLVF